MHMYVTRKNVLENREITLILRSEMPFATETRLVSVAKYISPFKLRVFTLVFRAIFLAVYMCIASSYFI